MLADTPVAQPARRLEGLFRCAEALAAHGQRGEALAIYEHLNRADVPQQVREGAARKVHVLRQEAGPEVVGTAKITSRKSRLSLRDRRPFRGAKGDTFVDAAPEGYPLMTTTRRNLIRLGVSAAGLGLPLFASPGRPPSLSALPDATPEHLPRWRGFNLLNKFMVDHQKPFEERDFADIAELGFDFVRLPLDYRCWTDRSQPQGPQGAGPQGNRPGRRARQASTACTSSSTSTGRRASRSRSRRSRSRSGPIPRSWRSVPTTGRAFAARYRGMPNNHVSFNLVNEPDDKVKPEDHRRVVERVAGAIRERDPERLIVCDGRAWATRPPTELIGLNVAAALHDYNPMPLTHYKASWVNWDESWPEPIWPLEAE